MKRIVIVANGNLSEKMVSQIKTTDFVIGVDRAAYILTQHGINPNLAIGDFDSVSQEEMVEIKKQSKLIREFLPRKDATDLELAIDYAKNLSPEEVLIIGAIGTRLDHSFVALQLLEKFTGSGISAFIRDENNECMLSDSIITLLKNNTYTYFSILPVTDEISISITGSAYPLKRKILRRGVSLGISNEITSSRAVITVHGGKILVIRSRD